VEIQIQRPIEQDRIATAKGPWPERKAPKEENLGTETFYRLTVCTNGRPEWQL